MNKLSRRSLARYASQQIMAGEKPSKIARQIASVMVVDGSMANVSLLMSDVLYELEVSGHLSVARLTTAREVTKLLEGEFMKAVKSSTGTNKVQLEAVIDPRIIGGYKLETATKAWDMTIKKKLTQLKEAF